MLSWIILIILLAILVAVAIPLSSKFLGDGTIMDKPESHVDSLAVIKANRQLLQDGQLGDVTFDVVTKGYRQDQVDDVVTVMHAYIRQLEAEVDSYKHTGISNQLTVNGATAAFIPSSATADETQPEKTES